MLLTMGGPSVASMHNSTSVTSDQRHERCPIADDESTRAAVDAVITVRAEQQRNSGNATTQRRGSRPE